MIGFDKIDGIVRRFLVVVFRLLGEQHVDEPEYRISRHRFDPVYFSSLLWVPLSFAAPRAGHDILVHEIAATENFSGGFERGGFKPLAKNAINVAVAKKTAKELAEPPSDGVLGGGGGEGGVDRNQQDGCFVFPEGSL